MIDLIKVAMCVNLGLFFVFIIAGHAALLLNWGMESWFDDTNMTLFEYYVSVVKFIIHLIKNIY